MNETKTRAYIELKNSNILSRQQRIVFKSIKNKPKTRQKISKETYLELGTVCGRVNELIRRKLIVVDREIGNREVLRLRYKHEIVKVQEVTHTQMEKWKTTFERMNSKQKSEAIRYIKEKC